VAVSDLAERTTPPSVFARPRRFGRTNRAREVGHPSSLPRADRTHLRAALIATDSLAIFTAWACTLLAWPASGRSHLVSLGLAIAFTIGGIAIINAHGLYLARNCAIRSFEMARIVRVSLLLGIAAWFGTRALHINFGTRWLYGQDTVGTFATMAFLLIGRSSYRAWITSARRAGLYSRNVLIIGANAEAAQLHDLFLDHPDMGFRVVGLLGDRDDAIEHGLGAEWCGLPGDALGVLTSRHATGVIVTSGALTSQELDPLAATLQAWGAHVHLSPGVRRVDYRRLRSVPLAYQPLLYLEPSALAGWQIALKRAIDLLFSVFALVLASPLLAVIAVAVKLQDRGPIFFRQRRVGRDGQLFDVYKFRTMVVDAEAQLAALQENNERTGPLFKMDDDPRVTKLGRWLRESSLDELPQLINVVKGEMSVVGPRPALPSEVEQFDDELLDRMRVRPGITGLWQVEARDNPSFAAYRRLDLYYVDNWSVGLDGVIIVATIEHVVARFIGVLLHSRNARSA
jgi:exopolysaccharide biosynthesis polyprenyl glycosylphosphotransferase